MRQKEQFSDGVGYSWIDTLKALTAEAVSDEQMAHATERFPINTPQNKEEYYYRSIFQEHFPSESAARSVDVYKRQKSQCFLNTGKYLIFVQTGLLSVLNMAGQEWWMSPEFPWW